MMGTFYDHLRVGREYVGRWGKTVDGSMDDHIRASSQEYLQTCVLAVISEEIGCLRRDIRNIARERDRDVADSRSDDPSDGMLEAIKIQSGAITKDMIYGSDLSRRSYRALMSVCPISAKDQNREFFLELRGVGEASVDEIMGWIEGQAPAEG